MLPSLTVVLGGARSGKSSFAEGLVTGQRTERVYVFTSVLFDDEMVARAQAHQAQRGSGWREVEAPQDLAAAIAGIAASETALIDCATLWLSNRLLAEADLDHETEQLLDALARCAGKVVIVTNEVGQGIVPENKLARQFRDAQGRLNQRLAAQADLAVLVAAGLPLVLKGVLP